MNPRFSLLLVAMLWLATTLSSQAEGISFGAWRWSTNWDAKTLTIKLDKIMNNRSSGYSGTLRVEIWATDAPIGDGPFKGWKMGYHQTKKLDAGTGLTGINMTVPLLKRPPAGDKYVTLLITEFKEGRGYVTQAKSRSTPYTFK